MTGNNLSRADPWLQTAKNDRDAAQFLRNGEFWSLTCFMCQQAAGKAVRAYLRACGETSHAGHGLSGLCRRCETHDADFARILDACRRLGRHYVATRYPDALGDETPTDHYLATDAEQALSDANDVVDLVEAKITELKQADATMLTAEMPDESTASSDT